MDTDRRARAQIAARPLVTFYPETKKNALVFFFLRGFRPAEVGSERPGREPPLSPEESALRGAKQERLWKAASAGEQKVAGVRAVRPRLSERIQFTSARLARSMPVFMRWAAGTELAEKSHASIWPSNENCTQ